MECFNEFREAALPVRVNSLSNNIALSIHFSMGITEFFSLEFGLLEISRILFY